jgi:NAD(P)-dependent dehydrogenase (short-subunit alcohol dehydrogenase family)
MRVVVTGSGGDLGSAICEALEDEGHTVLKGTHANCDVTNSQSVEDFLASVWPFQGLVCCHGAPGAIHPTVELGLEEWQRIIDVDLTGTFRVCRQAGRYMLSAGIGSIVNVASIHALATYPQRATYAVAKAGVVGLTRALAVEWASQGLTVNAVLPGQVDGTARTENVRSQALLARTPSGCLVQPYNVARAVLHLLENHGINGTTLVVDDGYLASAWWEDHGVWNEEK